MVETVEELEEYILGYNETNSTKMDKYVDLFLSDVSNMKKQLKKNELYVYTKEDYIEFLNEQINELSSDEEIKRNNLTEKLHNTIDPNLRFFIEDVNGYLTCVK